LPDLKSLRCLWVFQGLRARIVEFGGGFLLKPTPLP
jgi:hypothetical protein